MKKKLLFFTVMLSAFFSSSITAFAESAESTGTTVSIFEYFAKSNAAIVSAVISAVLLLFVIIFNKKIKKGLSDTTASQLTNAFIAFFSVSGIACLAMAFATDGETWSNLMHVTNDSKIPLAQFEDYIQSLKSAGSQHFDRTATTNTPFGHLVYFILAQFLPPNLIFSESIAEYALVLKNQTFMFLYLLLVVFCMVLLYRMNRAVLRKNNLNMRDEVVSFLLVVSYPTVYCVEKGNIAVFSIVLVMIFMLLRNNEKHLIKELSYVSLAAASALTPYTLFFVVLLLEEKTKKCAMRVVRTVLYFLILFISPAVFTGFGNLLTYMKALVSVPATDFISGNMSIANLLHLFGISNNIVIYAIVILTQLIAVLAVFTLPSVWQKTTAIAYIILNIFAFSDAVAVMFVFIPFIFLLAEKEHKAVNWLYLLSFALLITPFPEWFRADAKNFTAFLGSMGISDIRNANNLIALAAVQFLLVLLFYQMTSAMKSRKEKKISTSQNNK